MFGMLCLIFDDEPADMRLKVAAIYIVLIAANVLSWVCALIAFRQYPVLLGTALLVYGFGLRHAVDADHIAAIDNVTRKLMQAGKRPISVGLFFSLGHSTVVIVASVLVALPQLLRVGLTYEEVLPRTLLPKVFSLRVV